MRLASKPYSCTFASGSLWAVISSLCFVLSSSLNRKRCPFKSPDLKCELDSWSPVHSLALLLYPADLPPRGGSLGRNLRIPRSVTPFFGFMESLGGLLCAQHVPLGKEWGWDERRSLLQHRCLLLTCSPCSNCPVAAAPCPAPHTTKAPKTHPTSCFK